MHQPGTVMKVAGRHTRHLETDPAEERLTVHVVTVPLGRSMVLTVVLDDQSGLDVQEVGDAEEPAAPVVDRHVDQGWRQAGVEHPRKSEPRLGW